MGSGGVRRKKLTTDQMNVLSIMEHTRGVKRTRNTRKLNRENMFFLASDADSKKGIGLGWDTVGDFLGCEEDALHRYILGGEPKHLPWRVENRLNFLMEIVNFLRGSYNTMGIWQWFFRKRVGLGGKTPAEIFTAYWDPEDVMSQKILALAKFLSGAT